MVNWYTHRDALKDALGIEAGTTAAHTQLDAAIEGVCRDIDRHVGCHFYAASGTRYFRPRCSTELHLNYPLLGIGSLDIDADGDSTYETSGLASGNYYLLPDNATEESPRQPWWDIALRESANASVVFPPKVARGVKIAGTWGYYNERDETTAVPATAITAGATTWDITGASSLHPGQTIRVDSEQVFIEQNDKSGSATATSGIRVRRAINGTTAATHSSLSTMSVYTYPIIDRAALYQAELNYRIKDAPLGITGSEPTWNQIVRAPGGFHPFVRRILDDNFRTPRVG